MADDEPPAATTDLTRVLTAVRVRPFSAAETKSASASRVTVCVPDPQRPENGEVVVVDPLFYTSERTAQERKFFERKFNFDYAFAAADIGAPPNQEVVFQKLGAPLISHLLSGYNCSILAYGQTGSGKTFTMIGEDGAGLSDLAGIIPRLCRGLLLEISKRLEAAQPLGAAAAQPIDSSTLPSYRLQSARVSCSFYEIYCEKVYDLLSDGGDSDKAHGGASRVREHPDDGAYVENLTYMPIRTYEEAAALMAAGLRQRAVAETRMNAASSRSHAVFTIVVKQALCAAGTGTGAAVVERGSKIVLVDLAGSERASLTGATGERLIEANNINKSLSTLGDVIKALSEVNSRGGGGPGADSSVVGPSRHTVFVPYRNSILTFLLKDSLGGSSRTAMLATVSPSEASFNETNSTLRYVERAKFITAAPVVHESSADPAFVALLQKQIVVLQEKLMVANRSRQARDLELRAEFTRQESETARQHQRQLLELKEQLQHHQDRASQPNSPTVTSVNGSATVASPGVVMTPIKSASAQDELDGDDGEDVAAEEARALAEAALEKLLQECCFDKSAANSSPSTPQQAGGAVVVAADPGKAALLVEVHRLSTALADKDKQLASLAAVGAGGGSRLQQLQRAFLQDQATLQGQYAAMLTHLTSTSQALETERTRLNVLEQRLAQVQEECTERRAQTRRLENDVQAKEEEAHTARIEAEFLKAKQNSASAKHKQELLLLQAHVSKAKEAEEAVRREKEADLDRYTELMVDAQRRNESDRDASERQIQSLKALNVQLTSDVAALGKDKERFRDALNAKISEAADLESQLAAQRNEATDSARAASDAAQAVQARLQHSLDSALTELGLQTSRVTALEADLAAQAQELAEKRQTLLHTEVRLSVFQEEAAAKESERRRLASGEELLRAALDKEAQELRQALENVTGTTRSALDEKDRVHQDLTSRVAELEESLKEEKLLRGEAEKRATDMHAELTRRKKKLAAAIEALDENKARLAAVAQLESKLKAAEARTETMASALIESDTRHAKKDQKNLDLQAASARHQTKITELTAALREAETAMKKAQEQVADAQHKHKAELKSIKVEHALLLDEVIDLREQLEAQAARHDTSLGSARGRHADELEELDRRRADQFQAQQRALAAAEERVAKLEAERDAGFGAALTRARQEGERRRQDAVDDVQQRLDKLLLGSDEYDEQFVAVMRVLSMIDVNMAHIDAEMRSAALLDSATGVAEGDAAFAAVGAVVDDEVESPHLSPRLSASLGGILGRQRKLFGAVKSLRGAIHELSSPSLSPLSAAVPPAAFGSPIRHSSGHGGDSPQPPGAPASPPTHLTEHDANSLSQEIIKAKLALAVAASENEDQRIAYRRLERVACDLKLKVATLMGQIDDKDQVIGQMMTRVSELQRAMPAGSAKKESSESAWGLNLSLRGGK